jgi:hypothetical protein
VRIVHSSHKPHFSSLLLACVPKQSATKGMSAPSLGLVLGRLTGSGQTTPQEAESPRKRMVTQGVNIDSCKVSDSPSPAPLLSGSGMAIGRKSCWGGRIEWRWRSGKGTEGEGTRVQHHNMFVWQEIYGGRYVLLWVPRGPRMLLRTLDG